MSSIVEITYRTRNLKGAYLYVPKERNGPIPLVIWLTGGNDGAQLPLKFSLGKLLAEGTITPSCAVLIPAASYGHNYTTMTVPELRELIQKARDWCWIDRNNISLCGWSLGADAAGILAMESPATFSRVCVISNYPKAWDKTREALPPYMPMLILVGENEASARRDWSGLLQWLLKADLFRVPGCGHEIGEKIWTDPGWDVLGWLTGEDAEKHDTVSK